MVASNSEAGVCPAVCAEHGRTTTLKTLQPVRRMLIGNKPVLNLGAQAKRRKGKREKPSSSVGSLPDRPRVGIDGHCWSQCPVVRCGVGCAGLR